MRIVFVTPYPPSRAHARSLGFIVELAGRHQLTALALCRTSADAATLHHLRTFGVETIAIPDDTFVGGPEAADEAPARMRAALKRVIARGDVGVIQIEGARLARVAQGLGVSVVWDVVGDEGALRRLRQPGQRDGSHRTHGPSLYVVRGANLSELASHGEGERAFMRRYASVIVGSERDAIALLGAHQGPANPPGARSADGRAGGDMALRGPRGNPNSRGKQRPLPPPPPPSQFSPQQGRPPQAHDTRVCVIPEAVDLLYYAPQPEQQGRVGLVVCGDLGDAATIQGIAWLLREVAPRIWRISPQVNLTIVGRGGSQLPPGAFEGVQAQLHDGRVRLVEGVEDIRAIVRQAALVIVPTPDLPGAVERAAHESALEAMALGTPVVVTQAALAGMMAVPGRDLLVATSADRLATLALRVLGDEELWGMLARHGRAYVERRHSWRQAAQQLDRLYARIMGYPLAGEPGEAADADLTLEGVADGVSEPGEAFADAVSVMSMLGLVGMATNPLSRAPGSGRLAPRWR